MADDFCFALLRSTTLQILQSVGFESVQLSSADTLTDVFGQYMEYLASTVCEYAQLSGRSTGSAFDVMDGLSEISIDIKTLEAWLESEGKSFEPAWSDQSNPSRALEGIVNTRNDELDPPLVYEFLDGDCVDDVDAPDSMPTTPIDRYDKDTTTAPSPPSQHSSTNLPDYVPSYLPAFPIITTISKEEEMEGTNELKNEPQEVLPSTSSTNMPHPLTVKKKKKLITNPFTHITPFEESFIATDKDAPPPMALSALDITPALTPASAAAPAPASALVSVNAAGTTNTANTETSPSAPSLSLSQQRDLALKRMMDAYEKEEAQNTKKQRLATRSLSQIFQQDTQDDASAGTRLFGRPQGLLGDIVRKVAPPLALSTLSTPNLMVDVMTTGSESTPSSASDKPSSSTSAPNLITIPTKSSTSGSNNAVASASGSGISLTLPARSLSSTIPLSSTPATPTTASAPPPMLSTSSSMASLSTTDRNGRDIFDFDYDSVSNHSVDIDDDDKTPRSSTSTPTKAPPPPPSTSAGPISLASLASKAPKPPKPARKLTINLSNLQKKSEDATSTPPTSSKSGKFTISLPSKSSPGNSKPSSPYPTYPSSTTKSATSSPSSAGPKIRFTLKPPEPSVKKEPSPPPNILAEPSFTNTAPIYPPPTAPPPPPPPSSVPSYSTTTFNPPPPPPPPPQGQQEDMIRCICEHPTIDYGAFMIACDTCGVWFHGNCVGVSELDQVEEWHCRSCSS
ncbi:hypothetical protein [Absidia glauca]|uniref:PHD-type domain-containing protein n=1 Tax=Absidia glauca TaxID=4829 RepID=A0A163IRT2_ABSGL|nr:hypothetical protein [Absidia glauca]